MGETKEVVIKEEIEEIEETNEVSEESIIDNEDKSKELAIYRKKTVSISQETPRLLNEELNGSNAVSELESFYISKKQRLKKKNNGKALSYKQFKAFYEEFVEKETISSKNEDLIEFFEDFGSFMEKSFAKSVTISNLTQDSAVYIVEGSLLAIRNKITNMKFEELVKDYDQKAISKDALGKIKEVYNRIVNIINA